jgi:hypothetical protein
LNTYDDSKQRLAEIRQAEADLKAKAAEKDSLSKSDNESKRKRGGQRKPASKQAVAETTGVSRAERQRVEQHVELADRFPFMKRDGWQRELQRLGAGQRATGRIVGVSKETIARDLGKRSAHNVPPHLALPRAVSTIDSSNGTNSAAGEWFQADVDPSREAKRIVANQQREQQRAIVVANDNGPSLAGDSTR